MARDKKQTGKVKWFNVTKGYGFIIPDDGSEELFVHQSAVHAEGFRSLREGESVEFASERGEDGRMRAAEVTGPDGAHVLGAQPPGYGGGGGGGGGSGSGSSRGRTAGRATGRRDSSEQQLCYNCNEPGHLSRDCGVEQRPGRRPGGGGGGGGGRSGYAAAATGRSGGACFTCGGQGHFARDCTAATNGAPSPAAAAAAAASN